MKKLLIIIACMSFSLMGYAFFLVTDNASGKIVAISDVDISSSTLSSVEVSTYPISVFMFDSIPVSSFKVENGKASGTKKRLGVFQESLETYKIP